MSISLFFLPEYKNLIHVSDYLYKKGKTSSCKEGELEEFLPIWRKMTTGRFPGSIMKLRRRILDSEYNEYPIVFIISEYWPKIGDSPAHGHTSVHIVQKQRQNLENIKTYKHRFIDRETGVIILDKTILHNGAKEPDYKYWFYERDNREMLPKEILEEEFSKNGPGYFTEIKRFSEIPATPVMSQPVKVDMETYEHKYDSTAGYLYGEKIDAFVRKHTFSYSSTYSCKLIEWDDSWNFVVQDEFGQAMFRVEEQEALKFLEKNNIE